MTAHNTTLGTVVLLATSIFATAVLLSGCRGHDKQSNINGLANPAAVYCVEQGGERDTLRENGVNVTYCVLPSGERVDEWSYYREGRHVFK